MTYGADVTVAGSGSFVGQGQARLELAGAFSKGFLARDSSIVAAHLLACCTTHASARPTHA